MVENSLRASRNIFIILLIAIAILVVALIYSSVKNRNYIKTIATIINIDDVPDSYTNQSEDSLDGVSNYIFVNYKDEDISYTTECRMLISAGKESGQEISIRYNPDNPEEIQNKFFYQFSILLICICVIIDGLLYFGIIRRKRE